MTEMLESRRMFSGAADDHAALYDHGPAFDPNGPQMIQVRNRWSSTASGSAGSLGQGLTLTWSIVPDGTLMSSTSEPNVGSDLRGRLDALYGSPAGWLPVFEQVFAQWSAISGITYKYEASDDGVDFNGGSAGVGALGKRGDVRIGAHPIDGAYNTLAYNWFPSYGEMVIDSNDLVTGGFMANKASNSLRLRNVLAHEHGHGLGFNHVEPINNTKLMEPTASTAFDGPQFDDMLAVNRNYGDFFEKLGGNNTAASATNRGALGDVTDLINNASVATLNDADYYKFTLGSTKNASITLSPFGPTYQQGPQGGTPAAFDAKAQMDLQLQMLGSNGSTVLGTANAAGVGADESLSLSNLAAGTYYLKVLPAAGAADSAQMYTLSTLISGTATPPPVTTTTSVALDGSGRLTVTDTATSGKADALTVTADPANGRYVFADPNNLLGTTIASASGNATNTVYVPFSAVTGGQVIVSTLAGNDSITINGTNVPVTVDGGAGTDAISVSASSASAAVTIAAASAGNDAVSVNTDNTGAAVLNLTATTPQLGALSIGTGGTVNFAPTKAGNNVLTVQSLAISGNGKLDLRDNDLIVNYSGTSPAGAWNGSAYTGLTGWIAAGNVGSTSANGSTTLLASAEASGLLGLTGSQTTLWSGQTVDASSLLVKFTYGGDANLDGLVNGDDYAAIDFHSNVVNAHGYLNGDFNLDGVINGDDYALIDFVSKAQGLPL
jgi:hypothetical protein